MKEMFKNHNAELKTSMFTQLFINKGCEEKDQLSKNFKSVRKGSTLYAKTPFSAWGSWVGCSTRIANGFSRTV